MKDRIKKVRADAGLTQQAFGDRIKVSRNYVTQAEMGVKHFSYQIISNICREFAVNESWLVDGVGEPYIHFLTSPEIAKIAEDAAKGETEEKRQELIRFAVETFTGMDEAEIAYLHALAKRRGFLK